MLKTGRDHIASLQDGRSIFIDGALVGDATVHPAFARSVQSVGRLFDYASAPEQRELMTFETPGGGRANRIWQLPGSYDELVVRRRALESWAGCTPGSWAARRITSHPASPAW